MTHFCTFGLLCLIMLTLGACTQSLERSAATLGQPFQVLQWDTTSLDSQFLDVIQEGLLVKLGYWQDANGENYFEVVREQRTEDLRIIARHYVKRPDGRLHMQQQFKDFVIDCEYDPILDFIPGSLTITDMDSNQVGEVVFLLQKGCISDVSPLQAQLYLIEGAQLFLIRGTTQIKLGSYVMPSEQEVDPSFEDLPIVLQTYARAQWDRFTDTTVYYW